VSGTFDELNRSVYSQLGAPEINMIPAEITEADGPIPYDFPVTKLISSLSELKYLKASLVRLPL
jgi:hypothetical protein